MPITKIATELKTDIERGLSKKEAAQKQASFGLNVLPKGKKKTWLGLLIDQFKNPLIFILIIAALLTLWLREYAGTIIISISIIVNTVIGFWQGFRSSNVFEKLQKFVTVSARVLREGQIYEVEASQLVPGDIILLYAGMKVPADSRLISLKSFEVNEALLTGESVAVKKKVSDKLSEEMPLAERTNMVYMGTSVEKGEAKAVVVATGAGTELGQIAELTAGVKEEKTPLQERLANLGKLLSVLVFIFAVIIFAIDIFEGASLSDSFTLAVAIAVAAIPEGLPAAMSVVLAIASQRIFKKKGLVKTLIGAETLGSTTVICADKTGTLTEGKMKVDKLYLSEDEERMALILAMANEVQIVGGKKIIGEATDKAKFEFYLERGENIEKDMIRYPKVAMLPFDSEKKYLASFHSANDGSGLIFINGAPEKLLELSTKSSAEQRQILKTIEDLASEGFRLIGIGEKIIEGGFNIDYDNEEELGGAVSNISFLGIAAISDPIRHDVVESIHQVRKAGMRVIMITGDHKLTALSVGSKLGFGSEDKNIVEGKDLDEMTSEELKEKIAHIQIISRASPKHKMLVIDALRKQGEVVAMTGDGVNDAPALKDADIGISLGTGTDVTKEAADLVLLDDSFSTIAAAVRQGRIAFDNIRKVTIFLLSGSFTELILIATSLVLRIPLPLTAVQILWTNLAEDGLPDMSLAFDPGDKDVMERKPLKRREPILDKTGKALVFITGIISDFVLVGIFLYLYYKTDFSIEYIRTVIMASVGADSFFYIFGIKSLHKSVFSKETLNNKFLLMAVGAGMTLMFAAIYLPVLNGLLDTIPLNAFGLGLVFGSAVSRLLFIEVVKGAMRKTEFFKIHKYKVQPEGR